MELSLSMKIAATAEPTIVVLASHAAIKLIETAILKAIALLAAPLILTACAGRAG